MDIGKKAVIAIGMVCAIGATSAPATAQLTCGWCFGPAYGSGSDAGHGFPYAGGECGWRGSQFGMNCARCGGDGSSCHVPIQTGSCHIPCGPAGDEATAALTDIREALESDDVTAVAVALLQQRPGVSAEFIPEGGRIDLILSCDPSAAFLSIPVLPDTRKDLEAELESVAMLPRPGFNSQAAS